MTSLLAPPGQPAEELPAATQSLARVPDEHDIRLPALFPIFHRRPLGRGGHCLEVRSALGSLPTPPAQVAASPYWTFRPRFCRKPWQEASGRRFNLLLLEPLVPLEGNGGLALGMGEE